MSDIWKYKIVIRFSDENPVLTGRPDMQVLYSKHAPETDTYNFSKRNVIRIDSKRNFFISDKTNMIYGNGNSIHIQIRKAILLYCFIAVPLKAKIVL